MPTNPFFQSQSVAYAQDQTLFDSLVVEAIQAKGLDHYYLPRTLKNFDQFFGEDQASAFNSAVAIEMYLENIDSWGGEGSFIEKFGLEIRDSAKLIVSQTRFEQAVTQAFPEITRPREGDIIAFPSPIDRRMRFFEITFVNNEATFYQIGKLYTYELTVKNFEYTGETFETGLEELDSYEVDYAQTKVLQMAAGAGAYVIGERVSQLSGFSGEVMAFTGNTLTLFKVKGEYDSTIALIGATSGTSRMVATTTTETGNADTILDNDYTRNSANAGLLDFSEYNPLTGT